MSLKFLLPASMVHVCDRNAQKSVGGGGGHGNVWWRPALKAFEGSHGVKFEDGTFAEVDTVIWCTGYDYSFPFLEGSGLMDNPVSECVSPLYKQIFHTRHPSLGFIGLPQSVVPFPLFEMQAQLFAAVVSGTAQLPDRAGRERWSQEELGRLQARGVTGGRATHVLGSLQWAYCEDLAVHAWGWEEGVGKEVVTKEGSSGGEETMNLRGKDEDRGPCSLSQEEQRKILYGIRLRQAIYEDSKCHVPEFPGGTDEYRKRMYDVDEETGTFSVWLAERKANGEV
ncbi:unnamed protein product [Choristocarpus tenellus]